MQFNTDLPSGVSDLVRSQLEGSSITDMQTVQQFVFWLGVFNAAFMLHLAHVIIRDLEAANQLMQTSRWVYSRFDWCCPTDCCFDLHTLYRHNVTDHRAEPSLYPLHTIQSVDRAKALDRNVRNQFDLDLSGATCLQDYYCLFPASCINNAPGQHLQVHMSKNSRYTVIIESLCDFCHFPEVKEAWQALTARNHGSEGQTMMLHWIFYCATPDVLRYGIPTYHNSNGGGGGAPLKGYALSHSW